VHLESRKPDLLPPAPSLRHSLHSHCGTTVLLNLILEQYASMWPGKTVSELTITKAMCDDLPLSDGEIGGGNEQDKGSTLNTPLDCHHSPLSHSPQSDSPLSHSPLQHTSLHQSGSVKAIKPECFGEALRGGIDRDSTTHFKTTKRATQFSYYNGEKDISVIDCILHISLICIHVSYVILCASTQ
jgi:hypothetical protein